MSEPTTPADDGPQAAGVPATMRERLQQQCSDWGAYWRASDAHGVDLTHEQAVELLADALGVEVAIMPPHGWAAPVVPAVNADAARALPEPAGNAYRCIAPLCKPLGCSDCNCAVPADVYAVLMRAERSDLGGERAAEPVAWDASHIKPPTWAHVEAAFIEGAREARANPDADEPLFRRAADAYTKRVFEEVDPVSEEALRTESWLRVG